MLQWIGAGVWLLAAWLAWRGVREESRLIRKRESMERAGVLLQVGTLLTINNNGSELITATIYKIEGNQVFSSSTKYTERVQ